MSALFTARRSVRRSARRSSGRLVVVLLSVVVVVAAACGTDDPPDRADGSPTSTALATTTTAPVRDLGAVAPIGEYTVGRHDVVFDDTSRPTAEHGGAPALDHRSLPTMILYPSAASGGSGREVATPVVDAPAIEGHGAPVLVFGHGSTRLGEHYLPTLAAIASAGYVVAAPDFPLSKEGTPGGTKYDDIEAQSHDDAFVLTQVLALTASDDSVAADLAGLVDPDQAAVGGQSFGAITALAATYSQCCADARFHAALVFAGAWPNVSTGEAAAPSASTTPALFFHGDADPTIPIPLGRQALDHLGNARMIVLHGTGHDDGFFDGMSTPVSALVTTASVAFLDQHLKADADAAQRLQEVVDAAGPAVATLESPES